MQLTIRTATTADAALIAGMSRQTFYDTFAPDNTAADMDKFLSEQFTYDALLMEPGLKDLHFLLAFDGDTPAGYAKLRNGRRPAGLQTTTCLEVARFYAATAYIGKGVGKALMQACIDTAADQKKETIWLCVWEKNSRAIAFYTRWGFEKFGTCEFILGNDVQEDWMMQRPVGATGSSE